MNGRATWRCGDEDAEAPLLEVDNVGDRFSTSFYQGGILYHAILTPAAQTGWFTGQWTSNSTKAPAGTCNGRIYRCADDSIVLYGVWKEDGKLYDWFVYLK